MARPIDHLVLATRDLDATQAAYRRLGFLVGTRNRHPWGTENHIVQLEGSFLELIGLGPGFESPGPAEPAAAFANTLARYIARREGLAQVALSSKDAEADAAYFAANGIGLGASLKFGRTAENPDGLRRDVAFTVAFAVDPADPVPEFFVCQHHRPENFWSATMQDHPNTARRLLGVVMCADRPQESAGFLTMLFGPGSVSVLEHGVQVDTGTQVIDILTPARVRAAFGDAAEVERGGVAYRVGVLSLEAIRRFLNVMGSPYETRGAGLVVPRGVARGAVLSFEPLT